MPSIIDTHAHLDFPDFDEDREEIIRRATQAGVERIITIGTTLETSRNAIELAAKYDNVWATVGIHPNEAAEAPDDFIVSLRELAAKPKVAAIGEIGTDYHYLPSKMEKPNLAHQATRALFSEDGSGLQAQIADDSYKARQAEVFGLQLELAAESNLNVVIHQRDSWLDTLEIIKEFTGKLRAVFHCFVGSAEQAEELLAMGHLVSFTGIATFKNAREVHETIAAVPLDKLMLETDCPYLAPHPNRGKRCEPAYTMLVAERVAELKDVSVEEVAETTNATAEDFFRLG